MKRKVLCISALALGSTGKIMQGIANEASREGYDVKMFVSSGKKSLYEDSDVSNISTAIGNRISIFLSKVTGLEGFFAVVPTLNLIKKIETYKPNIVHLHILHHGYINLAILFKYLKKKSIPVVWTLHDCWAFTGHCPHFSYEGCYKWKEGCYECPRYQQYPRSLYDNSRFMWKLKKKWFSELSNLILVTPSKWLNDFLKDSYLNKFRSEIIYNGIDLNVFKPKENLFRTIHNIENKKIVLGVSSVWNRKKGIDVFLELARRLPIDYQIVLVGTDEKTDIRLPDNIISIHKTENQHELAEIYTAADVFVNPTREEVLGLVNLEALACGTPVITFDTGGSPECLNDLCGTVVPCDDIDAMEKEIQRICLNQIYKRKDCQERAKKFDQRKRYQEYIELYKSIEGE